MNFTLNLILSFLVGGAYVACIIWVSEKLGSRVGGAIAGLPSTILVGLIFIGISEGDQAAKEATSIVPFMFIATLIYGSVFLFAVKGFSFWQNLIASLVAALAWLISSLFIRQLSSVDFLLTVLIALSGLLVFRWAFSNFTVALPNKITLLQSIYLLRFLIGGAVIASAVAAAHYLGLIWGGIISSFPGLLGSVLYFLNKSQGTKFLEGFLRRLPFSYISSLLFLIVIYQTVVEWPMVLSFATALTVPIFYTYSLIAFRGKERI